MTARHARLGAVILATAILTGCGVTGDAAEPTTPEPSETVAPRDALLDAVPDEEEGAYRFTVKGGEIPMSGVVDASKKSLETASVHSEPGVDLKMTMDVLVVEEASWLRITFKPGNLPGLPKFPKKWMRLDPDRIDETFAGAFGDPGYTGPLVSNADDVVETAPGEYAGTTDLTKSKQAEIVTDKVLKALGDKAEAVPFTAKVDAAGNLTALTVKIPAAGKNKAVTYAVTYSGFGATDSPVAPAAGAQTAAPEEVYEMVNG